MSAIMVDRGLGFDWGVLATSLTSGALEIAKVRAQVKNQKAMADAQLAAENKIAEDQRRAAMERAALYSPIYSGESPQIKEEFRMRNSPAIYPTYQPTMPQWVLPATIGVVMLSVLVALRR